MVKEIKARQGRNNMDVLLDELYQYVLQEQDGKLSEEDSNRYVEIVDLLQLNNVEIPFGIEI